MVNAFSFWNNILEYFSDSVDTQLRYETQFRNENPRQVGNTHIFKRRQNQVVYYTGFAKIKNYSRVKYTATLRPTVAQSVSRVWVCKPDKFSDPWYYSGQIILI
jgi:hypothetical protein